MKPKKLFIFLFCSFFISWIFWGILAFLVSKNIINHNQIPFITLFIFGAIGPAISAYLSIWILKDKNGYKEYHNRLFKWKLNIFWYVFPFILSFGIIAFISIDIYQFITNETVIQNIKPWFMVFPLFIMMVFGGGLEELGWRGVALPELEKKFNPLFSSFIIGIIWAVWHLPLFFIPGINEHGNNFWVFSLGVMGLSFVLTWLYNHTKSIIICIIFHASFNMVSAMGFHTILFPTSRILRGMMTALLFISTGLLLLFFFPKRKELH